MPRGWSSRAKLVARALGWSALLALIAVAVTAVMPKKSSPLVEVAASSGQPPVKTSDANIVPISTVPLTSAPQTQKKSATAAPAAKAAAASDEVPVKAIGSKSAPITMEVFSDYQCPSCRLLYEQTLKPLINEYVATGKVYLIHRDFPLPMHKYSTDAARWVNAGAKIGRYPEVEAALYDNQDAWAADGNIQKFVAAALSPADFKRAEKLVETCVADSTGIKPASLNLVPQLHECSIDEAIAKDKALGNTVPVTQTPTYRFSYKGQAYPPTPGYVSWPILKQFFDSLLNQ